MNIFLFDVVCFFVQDLVHATCASGDSRRLMIFCKNSFFFSSIFLFIYIWDTNYATPAVAPPGHSIHQTILRVKLHGFLLLPLKNMSTLKFKSAKTVFLFFFKLLNQTKNLSNNYFLLFLWRATDIRIHNYQEYDVDRVFLRVVASKICAKVFVLVVDQPPQVSRQGSQAFTNKYKLIEQWANKSHHHIVEYDE